MGKRTYRLVKERETSRHVVYVDLDGTLPKTFIPKTELGPYYPQRLNLTIDDQV